MAKFEDIWREQCEATHRIRSRHGDNAALEYLVGEKLLHYVSAARNNPAFAEQLPAFVSEVRAMFPREAMASYLTGLEQRLTEDSHVVDPEDAYLGSGAIDDLTSLKQIVDLLRMETLGTA